MIAGPNGHSPFECVAVDLNTQHDFCSPGGANPVANLGELIPALRRTIAWVKRNGAPVISSIESRRKVEACSRPGTPYCVDGTSGQGKIDFTLLSSWTNVEVDNTLTCPVDLLSRYWQVIFRKRTDDLLSNPKADRMFTQIPAEEFILFGVGLEKAIRSLALGLLARGKRVTIVSDASGYWSRPTAELSLKLMVAKGALVTTARELRTRRLDRSRRYALRRNSAARSKTHGHHGGNGRHSHNGR